MKTKTLLSFLALGISLSTFSQKPTMELTFTAQNQGQYVPLDSILIENLTQGGDTTLYAPDTVLLLNYVTGIGENETMERNTFAVSQNYPNPFKGKTEVDLFLPEKDDIKINVRDILGRELAQYGNTINRGNHSFTFYSGKEKYYLLTITGKQTSQTIKMVNAGNHEANGEKCKIVYTGNNGNVSGFKSQNSKNDFEFNLGDELMFTAYALTATGNLGSAVIVNTPEMNTTYGFDITGGLRCPGMPTITDIDGNVYNTVLIGNQCWMQENLRVGTRIDGSLEMISGNGIEKYCYDDDPANCETYGGLYQWDEMMQYTTTQGVQGICPSGWHLPTDDEWKTMEMALGMSQSEADDTGWRGTDEGEKMKSTSGWYNNGNGTNSSGFNALPGGYRNGYGSFGYLGDSGDWWSSSEYSALSAWIRGLGFDNDQVSRNDRNETAGFSVRCLRDY